MNPNQNSNFKKFEDENDLANKNINLNGPPAHENKSKPKFLQKMIDKKEDIVVGMMMRNSNSSEQMSSTFLSKINGHLQIVGKYFNVEIDDIKEKLISSVIPMNNNFHVLAEKIPDLYGPFWIYTTLVFLVTFAGNLSNYINIYGVGFGIPLVLYLIMKFMFKIDISLVLNICVYGYSFTVLAPVLILCIIPSKFLETVFLLYFLASSSYFLMYNMANFIFEKAQASKYIILGILLFFQVVLFLTLKFYFFATFTHNK